MTTNDTTVAILREALDSAADRIIAKRERPEIPKGACPTCGRRPRPLTGGQVYAAMFCCLLLMVTVVGAIQR